MIRKLAPFLLGGGLLTLLIGAFLLVGFTKIEGREAAVVQDWNKGVLDEIVRSGTKFYIPATTTLYKYHIGTQKFIMGNQKMLSKLSFLRMRSPLVETVKNSPQYSQLHYNFT